MGRYGCSSPSTKGLHGLPHVGILAMVLYVIASSVARKSRRGKFEVFLRVQKHVERMNAFIHLIDCHYDHSDHS